MNNENFIFPEGFLDPGIQNWITECENRHPDWFAMVQQTNQLAIKVLWSLDAHNKVLHEILLATLYVRALHTFQGAVIMSKHGMITQAKMMSRCLMEVIFPFVAITIDSKYADDYRDMHIINELKNHEKITRLTSFEVADINYQETIDRANEFKLEKQTRHLSKISVEEWSRRAKLHDYYLTVYSAFSSSIHSNIKDLEEHLILADSGDIKALHWWATDKNIHILLMTVMNLMLIAVEHAKSICKIDVYEELDEIRKNIVVLVERDIQKLDLV